MLKQNIITLILFITISIFISGCSLNKDIQDINFYNEMKGMLDEKIINYNFQINKFNFMRTKINLDDVYDFNYVAEDINDLDTIYKSNKENLNGLKEQFAELNTFRKNNKYKDFYKYADEFFNTYIKYIDLSYKIYKEDKKNIDYKKLFYKNMKIIYIAI